jgi:predicted chitinase
MNELGLDNERELVYFSGQIMHETENMELLKEYVKYLQAMERSNKINYSSNVEAMPSHYFVQHYANCL